MEFTEAPPGREQRLTRIDWAGIVAELKAVPPDENGQRPWGKVGLFNPSIGSNIRQGRYRDVNPDEFDVTTRRDPESRKSWLFLRYRG